MRRKGSRGQEGREWWDVTRGLLDLGPPAWHLLLFPVVSVGASLSSTSSSPSPTSSSSPSSGLGFTTILVLAEWFLREVGEHSKTGLVLLPRLRFLGLRILGKLQGGVGQS